MSKIGLLGYALAVSVTFAIPTLAQQTGAPSPRTPGAMAPGTPAVNPPTAPHGPSGTLQKDHDAWRSAKIVGASVYNDSGDNVGSIDDLLIGDDGKIREVVIAVGGFLGLGTKLVTVPFDQLRFERSASNAPAPAIGSAPAYFSVVLPGATKDSLTKMGEFKSEV
jgi:hypothetical protein